ncbi:MAG: hypothetical protein H0Z37_12220 [Firmicutes bacterium]|nr:hypothetical protein [Bacillota bacterium]
MRLGRKAFGLLALAVLLGCARTIDDREGVERLYGPPEEEVVYQVGDRAYSTWRYWSAGKAFGFKCKEETATCGGEKGWDKTFTFTYPPPRNEEEKRIILEQLKLLLALTTPVEEERTVDLTPWIERARRKRPGNVKGAGPSPSR